jgi:hypothetical protein
MASVKVINAARGGLAASDSLSMLRFALARRHGGCFGDLARAGTLRVRSEGPSALLPGWSDGEVGQVAMAPASLCPSSSTATSP